MSRLKFFIFTLICINAYKLFRWSIIIIKIKWEYYVWRLHYITLIVAKGTIFIRFCGLLKLFFLFLELIEISMFNTTFFSESKDSVCSIGLHALHKIPHYGLSYCVVLICNICFICLFCYKITWERHEKNNILNAKDVWEQKKLNT